MPKKVSSPFLSKRSLNPSPLPSQHRPPFLRRLQRAQRLRAKVLSLQRRPQRDLQCLPPRSLRLPVFLAPETILLLQRRVWLVLVFLVLETTPLLQRREWDAPLLAVQARVKHLVVPLIAKVGLGLPSRVAPVAPVVDPVAPVSVAPVAVHLVAVPELAQVAVVPEPVDVDADPVVELQARSVAVAARVSPASRSGRSAKSLRCGRLRA